MTDRYKEALDALTPFINASIVPFSDCAKVCFCHSSAIKDALTLATESEQLRTELKIQDDANDILTRQLEQLRKERDELAEEVKQLEKQLESWQYAAQESGL